MSHCSSPQFGSKPLHAGASRHRVGLHSGELFVLGAESFMLVMRKEDILFKTANIKGSVKVLQADVEMFYHRNGRISLKKKNDEVFSFLGGVR